MALPTKICVVCGTEFPKPATCSEREWTEQRKFCSRQCFSEYRRGRPNSKISAALTGRKQSPEERAKRGATIRRLHAEGKIRNARANLGLRGEETSRWKGDDITYRTAHLRLTRSRGRPSACELCGNTDGWLEWALKDDAQHVQERDGRVYSAHVEDYFGACRKCHNKYDQRQRCPTTGRFV